jgi:hypothetical protein
MHEDFEVKVGDTVISKSTGDHYTVVEFIPAGVNLKKEGSETVGGCGTRSDGERRFLYAHYWEPAP